MAWKRGAWRAPAAVLGAAVASACLLPSAPTHTVKLPATVEAWIYPASSGSPACDVPQELAALAAHPIAILKPEYFYVANNGQVVAETAGGGSPCNGFSLKNLADVRTAAKSVLVTVSASGAALVTLLASAGTRSAAVDTLTNFVEHYGINGLDIDFEPNSWSTSLWAEFLQFLQALHSTLSPIGDEVEADLYAWTSTPPDASRYGAVAATGTHVVVMAYDDEYNVACAAITPFSWLRQVVSYSLSQVPASELTIGLPAYGYTTTTCSQIADVNDNLAYTSMERDPGFPKTAAERMADRKRGSGELRWTSGRTHYDLVDATALDEKLSLVESMGVEDVSVWSLGGQAWFSGNPPGR